MNRSGGVRLALVFGGLGLFDQLGPAPLQSPHLFDRLSSVLSKLGHQIRDRLNRCQELLVLSTKQFLTLLELGRHRSKLIFNLSKFSLESCHSEPGLLGLRRFVPLSKVSRQHIKELFLIETARRLDLPEEDLGLIGSKFTMRIINHSTHLGDGQMALRILRAVKFRRQFCHRSTALMMLEAHGMTVGIESRDLALEALVDKFSKSISHDVPLSENHSRRGKTTLKEKLQKHLNNS